MKKKKIFNTILFIMFVVIVYNMVAFIFSHERVSKLNEIERGEYSCIDDESMQERLSRTLSGNTDHMSWIYKDINDDGKDELILQEFSDTDRIVGIFAEKESNVVTVLWDNVDAGSYYQLCEKGLLHFNKYYGTYEFEQYILYDYDKEWNEIFVEGLELYYLWEQEEEEERYVKEHLGEQLKDMEKEKVYFWKFKMRDERKEYTELTEEEWKEKFHDLFERECEGEIFEYFL